MNDFNEPFSHYLFEPIDIDNLLDNSFNQSYNDFADNAQYDNPNNRMDYNDSNFQNFNGNNENAIIFNTSFANNEIDNLVNGSQSDENAINDNSDNSDNPNNSTFNISQRPTSSIQNDGEKVGNKKKKCGRKTNKKNTNNSHNKLSADNIIRKAKIHILNDKVKTIFDNYFLGLNIKKMNLLKIEKKIISLKKEDNMEIIDTPLKDIYSTYNIGEKYKRMDKDYNKKMIKEIYSKSEYIDLQRMFNLTFYEFFEIYTSPLTGKELSEELKKKKEEIEFNNKIQFDGIKDWIKELEAECKKNEESDNDIKTYINKIKEFCGNYRDWFEKKRGRNKRK